MTKRNKKKEKIRGRERPGESEVTVFIIAPDPLHRSGLSRAGPFNWEVNLRNQAGDENDKKKHFGILPLQRHLTFLMTFEPV